MCSQLRFISYADDNPQQSLFLIFNAIVRASPDAREKVLQYLSTVLNLNVKRAGAHVSTLFSLPIYHRLIQPFRLTLVPWHLMLS